MNSYIQQITEGKIDFVGQQQVDFILRVVLISATIISFVFGFVLQSLSVTFGIFGGATVLLALVIIPPWPMFNHHPVKWQAVGAGASDQKRDK